MRSRLSVSGQALYFQRKKQLQARKKLPQAAKQSALPGNNSTAYIAAKIGKALGIKSGTCTLNRVTAERAHRVQDALLQLQRQFGNRCIQRMVATSSTRRNRTGTAPNIGRTINRMRGSGHLLDADVRAQMEPIFGADFSGVRVHTGIEADRVSRSLNARAFTIGQDIFFRQGKYNSGDASGRGLLAHELTHVVQQQEDNQTKSARNNSWKPGERIQRATDKSTDGSQYIQLTIPAGPYVLEAANILADADWSLKYTDYLDIYATASQYKPKKIKGLDAHPHTIRHTDKGTKAPDGEFRIKPGSDLMPTAGKGSAKVQAFRHGHLWDDRVIQAYLQFDTVPLLQSPGKTKFIAGNIVDMDPKHHDYVTVAKGTRVGKEETSTISVSDGVTFSASKSITNTIGSEITRQLGAEIGLEGIGKLTASGGVKLSLQRSVTNAVGTSLSKQIQRTRQVKTTYQFEQPGNYAIVPTCKVWKTPIVVNTFDSSTGKVTGQKKGNLFTIIYNQTGSTAKVVGGKVDPHSVRTGSAGGGGSE